MIMNFHRALCELPVIYCHILVKLELFGQISEEF